MIITFGHIKGGVGKSTLCWHVGIALAQQGKSVAWADANPRQRSLRKLWLNADHCNQDGIATSVAIRLLDRDIGNSLLDMNREVDFVICDVPGHDSPQLREAMLVSDLFVIPTPPSQIALQDLPDMIAIAADLERKHGHKPPLRTLINLANPNPNVRDWARALDTLESSSALMQAAPRLPLVIYNRSAFAEAPEHGMGVTEYAFIKTSAAQSSAEVARLLTLAGATP